MSIGIRGKLFVVLLALILGVGLISGAYLESRLRARTEAGIEAELLRHARTARELVTMALDRPSRVEGDRIADRLGRATGARITIIGSDGLLLGDSQLSIEELGQAENHTDRPEVRRALDGNHGIFRRRSATLDREMLYAAIPYHRDDHHGVVRIAMPLSDVAAVAGNVRWTLLLAGVIGLGLAVMTTGVASHLLSRRLRALVRNALAVTHGERRRPVPAPPTDEIGFIAGSFDRVADRLDRTVTALARERDRFQTILEGMSEAVFALDSEGNITLANHAALDLLDLPDPVEGTSLAALNVAALQDLVLGCNKIEHAATVEFDLPSPPQRCVMARAEPLRTSGGTVVVIHDVTEMRRLETIRRDFVANVSHELRTPVSVIRANTETLLDGALEDAKAARSFLSAVHRNAERLTSIIADLLDLSRIEAQQFQLDPRTVTLDTVVRRAVEGIEKAARGKQLAVEIAVANYHRVQVDEKALEQVLLNLLDNAVKYTQEGGHVVARSELVDEMVRIEVCDDGPGIEAQHRDRIFERFYRVDPGRSREMGGTGLGLSIVKHLVNAMGGEVGVSPAPERGSIFWLTVPRG